MENGYHSFPVSEAIKYGIEKAILLDDIRFEIDKNKENETNIHTHTNGKTYYWTYNSRTAFARLFPYMKAKSIARWLSELEDDGVIISGNFNKQR